MTFVEIKCPLTSINVRYNFTASKFPPQTDPTFPDKYDEQQQKTYLADLDTLLKNDQLVVNIPTKIVIRRMQNGLEHEVWNGYGEATIYRFLKHHIISEYPQKTISIIIQQITGVPETNDGDNYDIAYQKFLEFRRSPYAT